MGACQQQFNASSTRGIVGMDMTQEYLRGNDQPVVFRTLMADGLDDEPFQVGVSDPRYDLNVCV